MTLADSSTRARAPYTPGSRTSRNIGCGTRSERRAASNAVGSAEDVSATVIDAVMTKKRPTRYPAWYENEGDVSAIVLLLERVSV